MNAFLSNQLQLNKFRPRLFVLLLLCLRSVYELVIRPAIPLLLNRLEERIYNYVWGWRMGVERDGSAAEKETDGIEWCGGETMERERQTERETERETVFILDGLLYSFNLGGFAVEHCMAELNCSATRWGSHSKTLTHREFPQLSHTTEPQ